MPAPVSDCHYGRALLDNVQDGSYPESEEVISAELPAPAIPGILKLLEQARNDLRAGIRNISRDSAPDINGWISQAKQLRHDIEVAHDTSSGIVDEANKLENIQGQVKDATSKIALLEGEIAFTRSLHSVFERIANLRRVLDSIQQAISEDRTIDIADTLVEAAIELDDIRVRHNTRIAGLLKARLSSLRADVEKALRLYWDTLIQVSSSTIGVQQEVQCKAPIALNAVSDAMSKFGLLEDVTSKLCKNLEHVVLLPRLQRQSDGVVRRLTIDRHVLMVSEASVETSTQKLFDDISKVIMFLHGHLPPLVLHRAKEILMPNLINRVQSIWLSSAVPIDPEATEGLQTTVQSVIHFGNFLEKQRWPGKADLVHWIEDIPCFWLDKRRQLSLDRVRSLLSSGPKGAKIVERVETQLVSSKEGIFASANTGDDWNAEWSDDDGSITSSLAKKDVNASSNDAAGDEEVAAWGLGEVNGGEAEIHKTATLNEQAEDAWGWGEDEETQDSHHALMTTLSDHTQQDSNGHREAATRTEREVTLKETYTITALPGDILETVTRAIRDAESMKSKYSESPIASAATGLFDLPRLVLTMYRASAPIAYFLNPSGNMFLYNDSFWLAERLEELSHAQTSTRLNISADLQALSAFGKRAYGKEMESQRTILSDLLDGAQGFAQCMEPPFAQECDLAINSAVERLHYLHTQWAPILSNSALLQSLGSLLSTLINKLIVDVEDMSDISEPESQRLAAFCNRVASLEDLFLPQAHSHGREGGETVVPVTAVYTPGWLKFQYLASILESSLVDIKFLWEEGELSLEFDVDELAELIEALFADSEHRRRAIGEMRRVSGRRQPSRHGH